MIANSHLVSNPKPKSCLQRFNKYHTFSYSHFETKMCEAKEHQNKVFGKSIRMRLAIKRKNKKVDKGINKDASSWDGMSVVSVE